MTFSIFSCFLHPTGCFLSPPKAVILRACDFFDLFVFFAPDQMFFSPLQKSVILSEAPRRSIAYGRLMARSRRTPAMPVGRCS